MTSRSVKVSINLDGLRGELQRSLQRSISLVTVGLSVSDKAGAEESSISGKSVSLSYVSSLPWSPGQLQSEFRDWLVTNGFRDSIESVSTFLESAHRVVSFWELSKKQKDGMVNGSDWNNIITKGRQKFHEYGFPDKLDHLITQHQISLHDSLTSQVKSINSTRNCLVHRNGIVTPKDLNTASSLEVRWSRMAIVIQGEDSEREFIQGEATKVNKGELVAARYKEEIKSFSLGKKVRFTTQEFADITWGLFLFGEDVVMKINKFGLENGFVRQKEEESA